MRKRKKRTNVTGCTDGFPTELLSLLVRQVPMVSLQTRWLGILPSEGKKKKAGTR